MDVRCPSHHSRIRLEWRVTLPVSRFPFLVAWNLAARNTSTASAWLSALATYSSFDQFNEAHFCLILSYRVSPASNRSDVSCPPPPAHICFSAGLAGTLHRPKLFYAARLDSERRGFRKYYLHGNLLVRTNRRVSCYVVRVRHLPRDRPHGAPSIYCAEPCSLHHLNVAVILSSQFPAESFVLQHDNGVVRLEDRHNVAHRVPRCFQTQVSELVSYSVNPSGSFLQATWTRCVTGRSGDVYAAGNSLSFSSHPTATPPLAPAYHRADRLSSRASFESRATWTSRGGPRRQSLLSCTTAQSSTATATTSSRSTLTSAERPSRSLRSGADYVVESSSLSLASCLIFSPSDTCLRNLPQPTLPPPRGQLSPWICSSLSRSRTTASGGVPSRLCSAFSPCWRGSSRGSRSGTASCQLSRPWSASRPSALSLTSGLP